MKCNPANAGGRRRICAPLVRGGIVYLDSNGLFPAEKLILRGISHCNTAGRETRHGLVRREASKRRQRGEKTNKHHAAMAADETPLALSGET